MLEAIDEGRSRTVPLAMVAGRVAESLPTGPDLAGWLATSPVDDLEDGALAGMAASYRRLASWAQAGELAVVAQLASRSAAADTKIGVDEQGRPARLPEEACAQVSLALTMSQASASWWSDLAVTLTWRLPATGAALRERTDRSRASAADRGRDRCAGRGDGPGRRGKGASRRGGKDHRATACRPAPRRHRGRPEGSGTAPRGSRAASAGQPVSRRGRDCVAGRVQPAEHPRGRGDGQDHRAGQGA